MAESFSSQLDRILSSQQTRTIEEVQKIVDSVAAEAVDALHSAYPGGTGAYNAGWTSKGKKRGDMYSRVISGQSPTFRLAHLLEHGHAKRNGGRVAGKVHIQPIEAAAIQNLVERLRASL